MIQALVISNLLLWALVLGLGLVVLALMRQLGVLHERVAPAGALITQAGPQVGEAGPLLELEDWSGRTLQVGGVDPHGRSTLLFFVSPTCPVCKELIPVVAAVGHSEGPGLRVVFASDGPREEHEAFVKRHGLAHGPYVLSSELGLAYRVDRLPHAVLLDETGVIRARGLVNTREHVESLFEAKERGVASLQELLRTPPAEKRVAWDAGGRG
ncbi:MAG: methylamine dehydrogenase accessory protein MauD [Myxococcota bacterium]